MQAVVTFGFDLTPLAKRTISLDQLGAIMIATVERQLLATSNRLASLHVESKILMRTFAAAWPARAIVQEGLAQITE